jgi:hypothetical protein
LLISDEVPNFQIFGERDIRLGKHKLGICMNFRGVLKQVGLVQRPLESLKIDLDSGQTVLAFFAAEWPLISPLNQILDKMINGRNLRKGSSSFRLRFYLARESGPEPACI